MRLVAAGACLWLAVSGCGQKGALYLPDSKPQAVGATPGSPTPDDAAARRKTQQSADSATTR